MIIEFKIFEQLDEDYGEIAKGFCNKALELLKPFNLSANNGDNYGNPEQMYEKFNHIKEIFIENFPDFELVVKNRGDDFRDYRYYDEANFKNKTLIFHIIIVNEGERGKLRMRVWIGSRGRIIGRERAGIFDNPIQDVVVVRGVLILLMVQYLLL